MAWPLAAVFPAIPPTGSPVLALPCVIDGFRALGYEMVTVSELLTHAGK